MANTAPAGGSEPTEEMLAAAERVTTVNRLTIIRIYQAMLSASPEVCASGSGDRETAEVVAWELLTSTGWHRLDDQAEAARFREQGRTVRALGVIGEVDVSDTRGKAE